MTTLNKWQGERQTDADLQRKFGETYVKASVKGKQPAVYYILNFDVTVGMCPIGSGPRLLNSERHDQGDVDIVQACPESGIYQLENKVLILLRNPARQFLEGLHTATCHMLLEGVEVLPKIALNVANAVFTPQQNWRLNDVLAKMQPKTSQRINNSYWLKQEAAGSVSLYRMRCCLGSWEVGKFFWSHKGKIFQEEVKDELNFHA